MKRIAAAVLLIATIALPAIGEPTALDGIARSAVKSLAPTLADIVLADQTAPQATPIVSAADTAPEYSVLHASTWGPATTIIATLVGVAVIVYAISELDMDSSTTTINYGDHYTSGGDNNVGNDSSQRGE